MHITRCPLMIVVDSNTHPRRMAWGGAGVLLAEKASGRSVMMGGMEDHGR